MFTTNELALLNRANVADAEASRIIDKYREIVEGYKKALALADENIDIATMKLDKWIAYGQKQAALASERNNQLERIRKRLKEHGHSDCEVNEIMK